MQKKRYNPHGSLMIRMIDIVFILLFGFIAVSQISQAEATKPPQSREAQEAAPDGPHILIVGVSDKAGYTLNGGSNAIENLDDLKAAIADAAKQAKDAGQEFRVRIRASWDASIHKSMRVARLCRELGYAKGIDVVKVKG